MTTRRAVHEAARAMSDAARLALVQQAVETAGGAARLADALTRDRATVNRWLAGTVPIPAVVVLSIWRRWGGGPIPVDGGQG